MILFYVYLKLIQSNEEIAVDSLHFMIKQYLYLCLNFQCLQHTFELVPVRQCNSTFDHFQLKIALNWF
jgi:hypothetical protein